MVTARSAAMAFNRYIDQDFDKQNERTALREIPSGKLKSKAVLVFVVVNCLLFILSTYFINKLCFYLSPIALMIIIGYSYTKRFTFLCHFILGLGLALAPIGAALAVNGKFSPIPIIIGISVMFWVTGFDIIYALQDDDFDKNNKLHSIPVYLGRAKALLLSRILHILTAITLFVAIMQYTGSSQFFSLTYLGLFIFILLLIYQHTVIKSNDLSKVNLAFFTTNGIASLIFGSMFILDIYF